MYKHREKAKQWLEKAGKSKIDAFIKEAMLTDFDAKVCYLCKKKESYVKMAYNLKCDTSTIGRAVARVYDAIFLLVL